MARPGEHGRPVSVPHRPSADREGACTGCWMAVGNFNLTSGTVGVPSIPSETTPEDLCDWDGMCAAIADSEPWWEPGTQTAYHAYPFGYIVGEIVRRATGKPISQVLKEDVAGPLGVANELFFGVPESELGRLARLEDMEGGAEFLASIPDDAPFFKMGPRAVIPTA